MESVATSVWAVVLGWNHAEDTIECLRSLSASEGVHLNLLYVDNGSTGDQVDQVLKAIPDAAVIRHPENVGVSGGFNAGLAYALQHGATHLFMANNDTITDPSCVRMLLHAAAAEPRAGILVPAVYHHREKDVIWSAGSRYRRFPPVIVMRKGKGPGIPAYSRRESLEFSTFCTVLFRAETWKAVGLLDPSFTFYCEDYDVCLRVRAAGFTLEYVPEARTWHKVERITRAGTSSPVFWRTYGRSEAILRRRHAGCRWMLGPAHRLYLLLRALWEGGARACVHFARGYREGSRVELKPVPQWADRVEPLEVLRALPPRGETTGA